MPQIQYAPQQHQSLANALGQGLGAGLSQAVQNRINKENMYEENNLKRGNQVFQQQLEEQGQERKRQIGLDQQAKEVSALQQALKSAGDNPQSQIEAIISAPNVSNELKKLAIQPYQEMYKKQKEASDEEARKVQLAKKYGIGDEDLTGLTSSDVASLGKNRNKAPLGGLGSQPVPKEVADAIKKVRSENPGVDSITLQEKLDEAGIPRNASAPYVDAQAEKDKLSGQNAYQVEAQKAQAKATVNLANNIVSQGDAAEKTLLAVEGMEGKVNATGFNLRNQLADLFDQPSWRDPESEEFKTFQKTNLSKAADIVRGKVSNFEFQTIADLNANVDKSVAANKAILRWQKLNEKITILKANEAKKIIAENGGIPPSNFQELLDKRTDGNIEKHVEEWRRDFNKSIAELYKRKPVKKGTKLDLAGMRGYKAIARQKNPNMDSEQIKEEARRLAKEDNYDF